MSYEGLPLDITKGGTNATNAADARTNLGVGSGDSPEFANVTLDNGGALRTGTNAADTALIQAYDVDAAGYTSFATLTANNTPTMDLSDSVTKAGGYIYRVGGTDVQVNDGGTGRSTLTDGSLLVGNGASAVTMLSVGATGTVLTGVTGSDPAFSATPTLTSLTCSGSGLTPLTLTSTDADAAAGPIIDLYRNSGTPAASDVIGQIQFNGQDTGPAKNLYASITGQIDVATGGSENSRLTFATQTGGALTTQLAMLNTGCQVRGNNTNTAPPAGFIGEQIRGFAARGAITTFTSGVYKEITNITLTPGVWDVNFVMRWSGGAVTGTASACGISTATASTAGFVDCDNTSSLPLVPSATADVNHTCPQWRVLVSSNTTYYLNGQVTYSAGTPAAGGRLSAVRVG